MIEMFKLIGIGAGVALAVSFGSWWFTVQDFLSQEREGWQNRSEMELAFAGEWKLFRSLQAILLVVFILYAG